SKDIKQIDFSKDVFDDDENVKTIDAFIYRFVKLQDYIGDKLFKELLRAVAEYKENMSMLDVLDKLEKLEIIPDEDRWLDYREVRNKLTHEYPDNENEILEGIQISLEYFQEMKQMVIGIEKYIEVKNLK
ncbi:nucleotidyltransferase substrate binding protein, partial [Sulfurimonas sp. SAG-AH-194-C21]